MKPRISKGFQPLFPNLRLSRLYASQGNRSMEILDATIKEQVAQIITELLGNV